MLWGCRWLIRPRSGVETEAGATICQEVFREVSAQPASGPCLATRGLSCSGTAVKSSLKSSPSFDTRDKQLSWSVVAS